MNGPRTLAVDPGRSTIGVAVFEGAILHYYAVKVLRVPGTPVAVRRAAAHILGALIKAYQPTQMVIEQPLVVQQRAELLAHVISALKTTARRHGLKVKGYSPLTVRRFICETKRPTKSEVSLKLTERYPELSRYTTTQSRWGRLYYDRMIGAIAVGLVSSLRVKRKRPRK